MDTRIDTLGRLLSHNTRRITALERAIERVAHHCGTDVLADELQVLAEAERDNDASSIYWRLARLARRS